MNLHATASTEIRNDEQSFVHSDKLYNFNSPSIRLFGKDITISSGAINESTTFSLEKFVLPPTLVHPYATSIVDHPRLLHVLCATLDRHALDNKDSKSRPPHLRLLAHDIAKIIECGWIRGFTAVEDWSETTFWDIANQYSQGGWGAALNIKQRLSDYYKNKQHPELINSKTMRLISSNFDKIRTNEFSIKSKEVVTSLRTISDSRLKQFKNTAIAMAAAAELDWRPYGSGDSSDAFGSFSTPGNRATNIAADELCDFLKKSVKFFDLTCDLIPKSLNELATWRRKRPKDSNPEATEWEHAIQSCKSIKELESILGADIRVRSDGDLNAIEYYSILEAFQLTCAYLVLFMNARRKDEVIHPKIGLLTDSLIVKSEELNIFVAYFYILKNLRCRIPFYVNNLTRDIFSSLSKIAHASNTFRTVHTFDSEHSSTTAQSIFNVPDIRQTNNIRTVKPYRNNYKPTHENIAKWAPAILRPFETRSMRRAYSIISLYRYVNGSLAALSYQLVHPNMEQTRTYVTDAAGVDLNRTIHAMYGGEMAENIFRELNNEQEKLGQEYSQVQHERLVELARAVIANDNMAMGGFAKILRRFSNILMYDTSYKQLDAERKAAFLARAVESKGYALHPHNHGDCWRGTSQSNLRGKCQEPGDITPNRAKASAETCNACPFQSSYAQHTINLERDFESLNTLVSMMPTASLGKASRIKELTSLGEVIKLRKVRWTRLQEGAAT